MARYQYLGEPARPGFTYHATTKIGVPTKDQGVVYLTPVPPNTEFVVGQDIGYDIVDPVSILVFDTDARYKRVP